MKNNNGFIATSMLYTFFLAFITLFIGVVTLYLQNRVYLIKLEDSSKSSIYLREMKKLGNFTLNINGSNKGSKIYDINNTYNNYNLTKCEKIYRNGNIFYAEGCEEE